MRTFKTFLFTLLVVTMTSSWSPPKALSEAEITFYISPEGSDSQSGTNMEQAFATLEKARDAIRTLKKNGGLKSPVTVYLGGGTYELSEPFILHIEDSGTEACPITYRAYNKEEVIISGGREIKGQWESFKGNIMVCTIPEARDGNWKFRQLFLNGKRMIRARTPDIDEYYRIAKADRRMDRNELPFIEGDIKKWKNLDEAEVVIFHSWNDSRLFISDIDEEERIVTFTGSIGRRLRGGATSSGYGGTRTYANRYFVENILEGLDQPGEWYLDTHTGKLYLYPTDDLEASELRAPWLHPLIVLSGDAEMGDMVRYVGFSGLTFADVAYVLPEEGIPTIPDVGDIYRPAAIVFAGTKFCSFENNCIRNVGSYAMEVIGDANTITRNEIYDAGGGGVITRSFGKEPNVISYNHIHDCGKVWFSACGINVDDGGGVIAHNLIHDLPQTGVYSRHWATETQEQERWNQEQTLRIEYNEIHDLGSKINDCAGIFVRDSNIVINNNLIYNVYSYMYDEMKGLYNDQGVPGWGIYLGCETRYSKVENNVVYNTNEGMHILHGARHNLIMNNIFVNCLKRQIRYESNTPMPGNRFLRNILYNTRPYSEIFNCGREHDHPEESDYNVFYYTGGKTPIIGDSARVDPDTYGSWLNRGYEKNSVIADPLFADPANHDYGLLPDSPALKLGFIPIKMDHVGLDGTLVGPDN